jgi:hypothetical protein
MKIEPVLQTLNIVYPNDELDNYKGVFETTTKEKLQQEDDKEETDKKDDKEKIRTISTTNIDVNVRDYIGKNRNTKYNGL